MELPIKWEKHMNYNSGIIYYTLDFVKGGKFHLDHQQKDWRLYFIDSNNDWVFMSSHKYLREAKAHVCHMFK